MYSMKFKQPTNLSGNYLDTLHRSRSLYYSGPNPSTTLQFSY